MKKTFFKALLALILVCAAVLCFASCGNSAAVVEDAESADGRFGDISWEYDADTKTLTIEGSGAINFESAEAADWYEVRHSVEEIEFDTDGLTEIGDYAFYYMPKLEEIEIPAGVTRLGDYAFAFCSSLKSIDGQLPLGLESIGEGCFESCIKLQTVNVPSSVTSIGARAFAHCSSLEAVDISATLSSIERWTFKGCSALDSLTLYEANREIQVDEAAFEDCKTDFSDVDFSKSPDGKVVLTINYIYEDGSEAHPTYTEEFAKNDHYEVASPSPAEGYVIAPSEDAVIDGYITKDTSIDVTYKKVEDTAEETVAEEETVAAEETEEEETNNVWNIIAIVIMAVVILAIVGLVIFMIISDKKNAKKTNASRSAKNAKSDNKKNKK